MPVKGNQLSELAQYYIDRQEKKKQLREKGRNNTVDLEKLREKFIR